MHHILLERSSSIITKNLNNKKTSIKHRKEHHLTANWLPSIYLRSIVHFELRWSHSILLKINGIQIMLKWHDAHITNEHYNCKVKIMMNESVWFHLSTCFHFIELLSVEKQIWSNLWPWRSCNSDKYEGGIMNHRYCHWFFRISKSNFINCILSVVFLSAIGSFFDRIWRIVPF